MKLRALTAYQWVAVAAVLVLLGAGATYVVIVSHDARFCTMVGSENVLGVEVPADLRAEVGTIRVTLRQGDRSDAVEFVPTGTNKYGRYIEQGVFIDGDQYTISLGGDGIGPPSLGTSWHPADRATAVVVGLGKDGRAAFRHTQSFHFDRSYPNGRACDGDGYYGFRLEVTAADAV